MAKESTSSSTIWRTVVFAGAMLGTPMVAAAEAPPVPANAPAAPTPAAPTKGGPPAAAPMPARQRPNPVVQKQEQIERLDAERTALLVKITDTDPKEIDALKKQIVAKDLQVRKLVDELVTLLRRPRTPVVQKPVGRGFVLA